MEKRKEPDSRGALGGIDPRTELTHDGPSFQEEPTGLEPSESASEGKEPDPAHASSHAAFTPAGEAYSRPAYAPRRISTPTLVVLAVVLAFMVLVLFVL